MNAFWSMSFCELRIGVIDNHRVEWILYVWDNVPNVSKTSLWHKIHVHRWSILFLLHLAYWNTLMILPFCISTPPIPTPKAIVSTSNTKSKFGNASTSALVSFSLINSKLSSWCWPQVNLLFYMQSVIGYMSPEMFDEPQIKGSKPMETPHLMYICRYGQSRIAWTFFWSTVMPYELITNPCKTSWLVRKSYFEMYQMLYHHISPIKGLNTWFINLMNMLGALHKPNDITSHSYKPSLILKVVFHSFPCLTVIGWYPLFKSSLEHTLEPVSLSTISSNLGIENMHLIVILLIALLYMHML